MNNEIGIIGAGPAGLMAAITAAKNNKRVTLLEKNEKIGKKLFITGKGRCNLTNAAPISDFFDAINNNKNFMYSSFYSFTNENIIDLMEKNGLKTKVERGGRVFPKSNKSSDVIKVFEKLLKENKVDLQLNTDVYNIEKNNEGFRVQTSQGVRFFDKLIIATGGKSYPNTGSTGDGYKFAEKFGHSIKDIQPSLIPIECKEEYINDLVGLSLRNVEISVFNDKGKQIYKEFGEMIFTHYGISGPIVLPISHSVEKEKTRDNIKIYIDLKPALDRGQLDNRLLRDFDKYNNKIIKNSLGDLLPNKLIEPIIKLSNIDLDKTVHQITREERDRLIDNLKSLELSFKKFRPINEAIVTSGGINVLEIDPSSMESKIIENLFFAGEIIDVDAITGGYNLQVAYSTGFLAGSNV